VAILIGAACLLAVVAAAIVLVARGGGGREATTVSPSTVRAALISRLKAGGLDYKWVVCVRTGRVYHGAEVVRCNVDYGEPHIVAYCSVIEASRLVTSADTPSLPCPADLQGWSATTVVSNN
jgi:hypothetical protein